MTGNDGNLKDILRKASGYFLGNWLTGLKIAAAALGPILILADIYETVPGLRSALLRKSPLASYSVETILFLGTILAFLFFLLAVSLSTKNNRDGRTTGLSELFRSATILYPHYLLIWGHALIRIVFGALLIIIPGLINLVQYGLAGQAFVMDGKRGRDALKHSRAIIRSNVIKYSDYYLAGAAIVFCLMFTFVYVFDSAVILLKMKQQLVLAKVMDYAEICVIVLLVHFFQVFMHFLYLEFKTRYESLINP